MHEKSNAPKRKGQASKESYQSYGEEYGFSPTDGDSEVRDLVSQILLSDTDIGAVCLISLLGRIAYDPSAVRKDDAIRNAANQAHIYTSGYDEAVKSLMQRAADYRREGRA